MAKRFFERFRDDRKYFTIVFFILILLALSALIAPYLVENQKEKWPSELTEKIIRIENNSVKIFKNSENDLLNTAQKLKDNLRHILSSPNVSYGRLVKAVNEERFSEYSVEVHAPNGKLIAWNSKLAEPKSEVFPLNYPLGETHFLNTDLTAYLSITDTLNSDMDVFYFVCSKPFEKHYKINNAYFVNVNYSEQIAEDNSLQAETYFNPFEAESKDGRKFSFDLLNNKNNKIGQVTITKPTLDLALSQINNQISLFQSICVSLIILFLALGVKNDFRQIKNPIHKLFLFTLFIAFFRYIIYLLGFPANLFEGAISDPAYFSSAFADGIVRSPIEFFITAVSFTIICIKVYQEITAFIFSPSFQKHKSVAKYAVFISLVLLVIFFLGLRGLSASLRSVIFDSTLRYFREPDLLSNLPMLMMNFNVLLLGFSVVLILSTIIVYLIALSRQSNNSPIRMNAFAIIILFEFGGLVFVLIQKNPLMNFLQIFLYVLLIFALAYHVYFKVKSSKYAYVYAALCASIISIVQLNHFNLELEKESLKTIAVELNRPNDNLYRFFISEVLLNNAKDEKVISAYKNRTVNFNSEAFIVWSQSSFQREALNSSVSFLDKKGNILGQFWFGEKINSEDIKSTLNLIKNDPLIIEPKVQQNRSENVLTGIAPIFSNGEKIGFINASIQWDLGIPDFGDIPKFLSSKATAFNSTFDFNQLKIFEFQDSKLKNVFGDIYPSRDQIQPIINSDFSQTNDAWLTLNLNEEKYLTYALRHETEGRYEITSVSLLDKEFSWNLFNFFKLFIVHFIFIILLFLSFFISDIKNFKYTFRFQLTIAFLLISLIPVVILALYNRNIVEQRTAEAITDELKERSDYIENYISHRMGSDNKNLLQVLELTGNDLQVAFALYDDDLQIYNSKDQYLQASIFNERLNPKVYYNLNYLSFRELTINEKIENYNFNSYYRKIIINNKIFILNTNDLFNQVKISFSTSDLDVLLFGIYFFAAMIIVLISTFLADKISSPIRKLTKATQSVSQGDLNISLKNNEKGELKELFDGFNSMTNDLKKNQSELASFERESAWKEMAKQVAHEIKNPLTPMKLSIQQLIATFRDKNKNFDSIFEKISSTLLNQIESLNSIASEFSRFAKMPSYKISDVDLQSVAIDVMNLFTDEAVDIKLDAENELPFVNADISQVRRLLINLIRNSIQAGASKIGLSIVCDDKFCNLMIKDNGRGIAEDIRNKIFDQDFTTKSSGMGIGLKLAKRFITGIGGEIQLLENDEPGAAFKVSFPISR